MGKAIVYECLSYGKEFKTDTHYRIKYCKTYIDKNKVKRWNTLFIDKRHDTLRSCKNAILKIASRLGLFLLLNIKNGSRVKQSDIRWLKMMYAKANDHQSSNRLLTYQLNLCKQESDL